MFTVGQRVTATPMARLRFSNLVFGVHYTVCAVHQAKDIRHDATYDIADMTETLVASNVDELELRTAFVPSPMSVKETP